MDVMNQFEIQDGDISGISDVSALQIIAYTDGASRGNPGRGGYGAVVLYPDIHGQIHIDEIGGYEDPTTNNRMELSAVLASLNHFIGYYDQAAIESIVGGGLNARQKPVQKPGQNLGQKLSFSIYTDSSYVLKGINEWIHGWKRNNWITSTKEPVKNEDVWRKLDQALQTLKKLPLDIKWVLLPGHAGVPGNERADEIATGYADERDGYSGSLYKGKANDYERKDVLTAPSAHEIEQAKKEKDAKSQSSGKKNSSVKGYSYLSLTNGVLHIDKTWAECEKRVKGISGAKFKKSTSAADEEMIKKEFTKNI
jgi:ribonuclease HI